MSRLPYRFKQSVKDGRLPMNSFQVIHLKYTFVLKDKVSRSNTLWVWEDVDSVPMSYRLSCSIK